MAVYFLDNDQQLIKIVPDNGAISILQTQELPEDGSLLKDMLSVHLKNDERLFDAQYMAIKSYDGNRNSFDMYRIVNELVPDNATEFEGVQVAPYELEGVVVEDIRPQGWTIERTTNQILKDSDWRLGYVDDNLPTVTTNFYYLSAKDSLKKLQELTGVEFTFKVEISGNKITDKWVEVYRELGNRTLKRFNYGTNALTVKRETSHSELYTALIGRGKGEEVGETDAGDATYGRKINFADVEWKKSAGKPVDKPKGQKYIELPQATAEFGVKMLDGRKVPRIGMVEFSDTEDPEVLIEQTWQALQEYARPKVLFSATVANIGDTGIGDTVTIHRHDLNMHYKTRVRKVMRNRKNNDKTQVEIGDVVYTASTKRQSNINSKLNNMENDLSNVRDEVSHVVVSADGKNTINYGNAEPERKRVGDSWVRDHPSLAGETQWLVWNGEAWELILDTSETTLNKEAIEQAQADIEQARQVADEAVDRINGEIAGKFTDLDTEISQVHQDAQNALNQAGDAVSQVAYFGETLDGFTQTVANIDGRVANIRHDVDGITQTVTDHTGKIATVEQNVHGIQQTVSDPVNGLVTQVSTLANGFNVLASDFEDLEYENKNILLNSNYDGNTNRWELYFGAFYDTPTIGSVVRLPNNNSRVEQTVEADSETKYTISVYGGREIILLIDSLDGENIRTRLHQSRYTLKVASHSSVRIKTLQSTKKLRIVYLSDGDNPYIYQSKLEKGTVATDWTPAPEDMATQAQLSVLNDNINMRVSKGELMSQINIEAGRTLIQSNKLYLDAQSVVFSGQAFIPGAVIENASIDGAKIADATIGSAKIANLDVNKISGNRTEFVQSAWNNAVGGIEISGNAITGNKGSTNRFELRNDGSLRNNYTSGSINRSAIMNSGFFQAYKDGGQLFLLGNEPHDRSLRDSTLGVLGVTARTEFRIGRYDRASTDSNIKFIPYIRLAFSGGSTEERAGRLVFDKTWLSNGNGDMRGNGIEGLQRIDFTNGNNIQRSTDGSGRMQFMTTSTFDFRSGLSGSTLAMRLSSTHMLLHRTLSMEGHYITNAAGYRVRSERKYKSNIIPLENAMKTIEQMNFYEYEKGGVQELGIIADEAPEIILSQDKKTVDIYSYTSLIGKSNQELIKRVKELETEVAELKGMIA